MSLHDLITSKKLARESIAFASSKTVCGWGQIISWTEQLTLRLSPFTRKRVGLIMRPDGVSFACLAALDKLECDTVLLGASSDAKYREQIVREFFLTALIDPCVGWNAAAPIVDTFNPVVTKDGQGRVIILTSGTTGKPKGVQHTWRTLLRPSRSGACGDLPVWFSSYALHLYAGLQVACQSMVDSGTFVYTSGPNDFVGIPNLFRKYGVQYAAGTPSFWRRICLFSDRDIAFGTGIKQITLGGEVVDQNILDKLKNLFPKVRLVHIYATTELGRCFSVTDGRAGFPLRFCDKVSADGIQLKIHDGQLYVRSANAMVGYDESAARQDTIDDWFATGDLVTVEEDRVHFSGRASDIINVGGNKIKPLDVENVIRNVKDVLDVRVYPQKSTLVGNLVACDVVTVEERDEEQIKSAIISDCHQHFSAYHVPRFINFVDHIELSNAGKIIRRWSI